MYCRILCIHHSIDVRIKPPLVVSHPVPQFGTGPRAAPIMICTSDPPPPPRESFGCTPVINCAEYFNTMAKLPDRSLLLLVLSPLRNEEAYAYDL